VVVVVIDALEKASALAVLLTAGVLPVALVSLVPLASIGSLVASGWLVAFTDVGIAVGADVGAVGTDVGIAVGRDVGISVGSAVGADVGARVSVNVVRDTTTLGLGPPEAAAKDRVISVIFSTPTAGGINSMRVAGTPVLGL
jgi:hypothetical protein